MVDCPSGLWCFLAKEMRVIPPWAQIPHQPPVDFL